MYDRNDSTVGALKDSWILNLGSLSKCTADKRKLREWTEQQKILFKDTKK